MKDHPIIEAIKQHHDRKPTTKETIIGGVKIIYVAALLFVIGWLAVNANAGVVVFQADGLRHGAVEGETNLVLTAKNGIKLYASSDEWKRDANTGIIFNAVGSGAFPFRVEANSLTSSKYVKTIFIVTTNAPSLRIFETLLASGERARIAGMGFNEIFSEEAVMDEGAFTIADWAVDLAPRASVKGGQKSLIEIVFGEPQPLQAMQFLSEGRADAWLRAWRGGLIEIIAVGGTENDNDPVSQPVREAIAHYVRLRHGLTHLQVMSTPAGRAAGSVMGIDYAGVFGTIYTIR